MRYTITAVAILVLAIHQSAAQSGRTEVQDQSKEVVELVNLLARDDDPAALERVRWLLMTGKSPAEVLDPAQKSPGHVPEDRDIPRVQREAFEDLAEYVVGRPASFPCGLPPLPPEVNKLRLAPFFDYLVYYFPIYQRNAGIGERLDALLDESWLAAAEACGRREIGWFIDIQRGRISENIRRAEVADDHLALGEIGKCLQKYPGAWESIPHARFKTRTLALLLSGLSWSSGPFSAGESTEAYWDWRDVHPGLLDDVRHLMGDYRTDGFQAIDLWQRGKRVEAWGLLLPPVASDYSAPVRFGIWMCTRAPMGDDEAETLFRDMPREARSQFMTSLSPERNEHHARMHAILTGLAGTAAPPDP
jgi:hypothetical protein